MSLNLNTLLQDAANVGTTIGTAEAQKALGLSPPASSTPQEPATASAVSTPQIGVNTATSSVTPKASFFSSPENLMLIGGGALLLIVVIAVIAKKR